MTEIVYKSKNAIVISKPFGMPSQPDPSGDRDALSETSLLLKENGEDGKLWLIHRLDRGVGGLMIFARNKESAALLSEYVRERQLNKEYLAVIEGVPESQGVLTDYLFKDSRTGKAYIAKSMRSGVKEAKLEYKLLQSIEGDAKGRSLVFVKLHTGRFHQIRAQFSSRHFPLVGDKKYGSKDFKARQIALFACHLSVELRGEVIDVWDKPSKEIYPWNIFDNEVY